VLGGDYLSCIIPLLEKGRGKNKKGGANAPPFLLKFIR
jgi:hypothetical protein